MTTYHPHPPTQRAITARGTESAAPERERRRLLHLIHDFLESSVAFG
jgi:hypothetical protein